MELFFYERIVGGYDHWQQLYDYSEEVYERLTGVYGHSAAFYEHSRQLKGLF